MEAQLFIVGALLFNCPTTFGGGREGGREGERETPLEKGTQDIQATSHTIVPN